MRLSVVIPAYNEASSVAATIRSATAAVLAAPQFADAEIIVADDGSTDATGAAALAAEEGVPVRVERLAANGGRFVARRHGLEAAHGEYVLFLDAGVVVNVDGLRFVGDELDSRSADVWNAHTLTRTEGNPLGYFWSVVSALAFPEYLENPRTTSFGAAEFDRFPKGTTCFFAPRELLLRSFAEFRSRYADPRNANDDTPLLRWVAKQRPINISPRFACTYTPRDELGSFVRHAAHRGVVFLDGHGRRESRFFPLAVAFYPASLLAAALVVRRPVVVPAVVAVVVIAAASAAARRTRRIEEVVSFALLSPVYLAAHGAGMWRGLALATRDRLRSGG